MIERIDRRFYPHHEKNWDDQLSPERCLKVISSQTRLLDLGAGAGIVQAMNFRGLAGYVCGVDLNPRVEKNPFLDEERVSDAGEIPYPDASFYVVIADNVMEHLDHPDQVFHEIARVLRPGGKPPFKTPNRSHYMQLIARLTPHRFHQWVNCPCRRHGTDTFPTRYLCNSPAKVRRIAAKSGLQIDGLKLIEGRPEYLRINAFICLVGLSYERLVNAAPSLARFRTLLVATLSKPA